MTTKSLGPKAAVKTSTGFDEILFVKARPSGGTDGSPATVAKAKAPCGGQWCVAVVQAAHGAQLDQIQW